MFVLGTAQFGLDYGITNKRGLIPGTEAKQILQVAAERGVQTLDTAAAYGGAEETLGALGASSTFAVITKIGTGEPDLVKPKLEESLRRLKTDKVSGVLIHDFKSWEKTPESWNALSDAQAEGLTEAIGLSLYAPEEWKLFYDWAQRTKAPMPDIVQAPLSVFDQRFVPHLRQLKNNGVRVMVRSVFLQGVGFCDPEGMPEQVASLKPSVLQLGELQGEVGASRAATLLTFPLVLDGVDDVVLGVDSLGSFLELLEAYDEAHKLKETLGPERFSALDASDDRNVLPTNW